MFIDYRSQVLAFYERKKAENALSHRLLHVTPAKLKEECLEVCAMRYQRKDERTLSAFFGKQDGREEYLRAIKRLDTDKFRPPVNFVRSKVADTDEKNVELLAWLIDFDQRPFEYGKQYGEPRAAAAPPATETQVPAANADMQEGEHAAAVEGETEQQGEQAAAVEEDETKQEGGNAAAVEGETEQQGEQAVAVEEDETKQEGEQAAAVEEETKQEGENAAAVEGETEQQGEKAAAVEEETKQQGGNEATVEVETKPEGEKGAGDETALVDVEAQEAKSGNMNGLEAGETKTKPLEPIAGPQPFLPSGARAQRMPKLKKGQLIILCLAAILACAGVYLALKFKWEMPPEGCMYWAGDHYERISCNEKKANTLIIAYDAERLAHFRKITTPDTITYKSIGRVWYIKLDGNLEYFTADGYHPVEIHRKLHPITEYIIRIHLHPATDSTITSGGGGATN